MPFSYGKAGEFFPLNSAKRLPGRLCGAALRNHKRMQQEIVKSFLTKYHIYPQVLVIRAFCNIFVAHEVTTL